MRKYINRYGDLDVSILLGQTLTAVEVNSDDEIVFRLADGRSFEMSHCPECCEHVSVEDIAGDVADLIGSPLTMAEKVTSNDNPPDADPEVVKYQDSFTWTFYKFATVHGYVTIRWYGESNGYYSEEVEFTEFTEVEC